MTPAPPSSSSRPRGHTSPRWGACPRITQLVPDHGSLSGGYPVTIIGTNLPPVARVHLATYDDQFRVHESVQVVRTIDGTRATVTMIAGRPSSTEPPIANMWIEGWPYEGRGNASFAFDQAVDTSTTSTPAPATTTPSSTTSTSVGGP
jgi:hypothetical protein